MKANSNARRTFTFLRCKQVQSQIFTYTYLFAIPGIQTVYSLVSEQFKLELSELGLLVQPVSG